MRKMFISEKHLRKGGGRACRFIEADMKKDGDGSYMSR